MTHLYHAFSQSRRIVYGMHPRVDELFFALNHHNYARWMVLYQHNFVKLPTTHVFDKFKDGLFSIYRTEKSFSGSSIDLTLEQTINTDAANQKKRITAITNSTGACQCWVESHSLRTIFLTQMFSNLRMNKKEMFQEI